jgi:PIN domain nuclease of toxin-antitoxin system
MQVKLQLGKLNFNILLEEKIHDQQVRHGLQVLPVMTEHVFALEQLADYHRDPFDRMLIAQAMYLNVPIISNDEQIKKYPLTVIW